MEIRPSDKYRVFRDAEQFLDDRTDEVFPGDVIEIVHRSGSGQLLETRTYTVRSEKS